MRRKLFCFTVFMTAGICVGCHIHLDLWLQLLIFGIFFLLSMTGFFKSKWPVIGFLLGIILLTVSDYAHEQSCLSSFADMDNSAELTGTVIKVEQRDEDSFLFLIKLDGEHLMASYYSPLDHPWKLIGCQISFSAPIQRPNEASNPRTFDYRLYLKSENIWYVCTIDSFFVKESSPTLWHLWNRFILEKKESFLAELHCRDEGKGFVRGVLFGDTSMLNEAIEEDFRKNGTAHVLAVSGLHVGILYGGYRFIYQRLRWQSIKWIFGIFLILYGTVSMWSVSVTRAVCLIFLKELSDLLEKRYDFLTALSAAAMLAMMKNPYVIFGAAFQMSFLAAASMSFLQLPMEKLVGRRFSVAAAVQAGLTVYICYTFNYVSVIGFFCNIPIVFFISIFVPFGIGLFLLFFCTGLHVPVLDSLLDSMAQLIMTVNTWFAADGAFSFDVASPPLWMVVLFYGLLFYLSSEQAYIYFRRKEWKRALLPCLLVLVAAAAGFCAGRSAFDQANLIFVDVGQGDCLHIKNINRMNVLIDGGGNLRYNVGEKVLKPYLLKNGVTRINLAAATHLHTDHYLGLEQLENVFPIDEKLTVAKAGQMIDLGKDCKIEILWPLTEQPDTEDENLNSLIFMVHYRNLKTLVTGDITEEGEAMLTARYKGTGKLQADVLKIAHHGSAYSTSDGFLDAVNPDIAVISVGKNNYGHPAEIVIEKLRKRGIMVFRTDQDGAVGIINREGKISVCTEKHR